METKMKILDLVKDNTVVFMYYRNKELWYEIEDVGFRFPVPIDDCGDGHFGADGKAITYMRWIRKQLEAIEKEKAAMM